MKHNSETHEAARLARLARIARAEGRALEAGRLESKALLLVGYQAPRVRQWCPSVNDSLPVGRKAVGIILALTLELLGALSPAQASEPEPGSWEWAKERAAGCPVGPGVMGGIIEEAVELKSGAVEYSALCLDADGFVWLTIAPAGLGH